MLLLTYNNTFVLNISSSGLIYFDPFKIPAKIYILTLTGIAKEGGAGAVDEDDFIKAFTDVPTIQVELYNLIMFLR